jgi:ribosomal protein L40E
MYRSEIESQLVRIAYQQSKPFCMGCYAEVKRQPGQAPRCSGCGSDDLAFLLPGHGCDWNTDWIVRALVAEHVTPVDIAEAFEESIRECYEDEVTVGWMKLDAVSVMKEMDPVSWRIAESEWVDQQIEDDRLFTVDGGSTYYAANDLETFIDDLALDACA